MNPSEAERSKKKKVENNRAIKGRIPKKRCWFIC